MTRISWAAALGVLAAVECSGQEPTAGEAIARARAATFVVPEAMDRERVAPPEITRRVDQASRAFEQALVDAAARLTPAALAQARADEATSIDAKLAVIADDLRQRPAVYSEIFDTYVRGRPRPTRVERAPAPSAAHVAEAYRLPWEFFLLSPTRADTLPYGPSAARAINRIGNPRSASTLLHMVRVATRPEARAEDSMERQRLALDALSGMPTARGASAIAESLDLISAHRQRQPAAYQAWDPVDFLAKRIDALPRAQRDAWPPLLRPLAARPEAARLLKELQLLVR